MLVPMHYANGNFGAKTFLTKLQNLAQVEPKADLVVKKITDNDIFGTDLWVLYSDLCGQDMDKVIKLCENCPNEILVDACSRQDYSGSDLVKSYLE
jgi:hypothetical protein